VGFPAEWTLSDELAEIERSSDVAPPGLDAAIAGWRAALERYAAHVAKAKRHIEGIERKAAAVPASVRAAVARGEVDLDGLIDQYELTEKILRDRLLPRIAEVKREQRRQFSLRGLAPADRARAVNAYTREAENMIRALEIVRDTRWALMALRADVQREGGSRAAATALVAAYEGLFREEQALIAAWEALRPRERDL
jgi:hypothetical protein